jgi:cytidylate kinase
MDFNEPPVFGANGAHGDSTKPQVGGDTMAVITISRKFGAGGTTLGARLSQRLGYRYVDDALNKEVAKKVGVSPRLVRTLEKRGTSKLMKLLDKIVSPGYIDRRHVSDTHVRLDENRYVEEVKAVIYKLYEEGNVVIIGRGSNYTLQGFEDTVHVLLLADFEHRVRFLMDTYKLTENAAEKAVKRADMVRSRFLSYFSDKEDHDDPMLYTLTLNMNRISMETAEELVYTLVAK